jgi:aminoglycoside phosphotransferase family enzyme
VIIDCLEFRADFRVIDPVDELAFLGLECERLGAPWVGPELLQVFAATGDRPPALIVDFYAVRRAVLRAKLAVWHMRDGEVRTVVSWPQLATTYLELTAARCQRLLDASRCA